MNPAPPVTSTLDPFGSCGCVGASSDGALASSALGARAAGVAASAAANDVYARLVRRGTPSAWVNRITVLILGLGAIGLVLDPDLNVFSFVLEYGWAVLGAGFGPQVLLALWWKGATRAGAIAGIATGFGVALGWKWFYDPAATGVEIYNLPVAFIAALAVNMLVSLATDRADREPAA